MMKFFKTTKTITLFFSKLWYSLNYLYFNVFFVHTKRVLWAGTVVIIMLEYSTDATNYFDVDEMPTDEQVVNVIHNTLRKSENLAMLDQIVNNELSKIEQLKIEQEAQELELTLEELTPEEIENNNTNENIAQENREIIREILDNTELKDQHTKLDNLEFEIDTSEEGPLDSVPDENKLFLQYSEDSADVETEVWIKHKYTVGEDGPTINF